MSKQVDNLYRFIKDKVQLDTRVDEARIPSFNEGPTETEMIKALLEFDQDSLLVRWSPVYPDRPLQFRKRNFKTVESAQHFIGILRKKYGFVSEEVAKKIKARKNEGVVPDDSDPEKTKIKKLEEYAPELMEFNSREAVDLLHNYTTNPEIDRLSDEEFETPQVFINQVKKYFYNDANDMFDEAEFMNYLSDLKELLDPEDRLSINDMFGIEESFHSGDSVRVSGKRGRGRVVRTSPSGSIIFVTMPPSNQALPYSEKEVALESVSPQKVEPLKFESKFNLNTCAKVKEGKKKTKWSGMEGIVVDASEPFIGLRLKEAGVRYFISEELEPVPASNVPPEQVKDVPVNKMQRGDRVRAMSTQGGGDGYVVDVSTVGETVTVQLDGEQGTRTFYPDEVHLIESVVNEFSVGTRVFVPGDKEGEIEKVFTTPAGKRACKVKLEGGEQKVFMISDVRMKDTAKVGEAAEKKEDKVPEQGADLTDKAKPVGATKDSETSDQRGGVENDPLKQPGTTADKGGKIEGAEEHSAEQVKDMEGDKKKVKEGSEDGVHEPTDIQYKKGDKVEFTTRHFGNKQGVIQAAWPDMHGQMYYEIEFEGENGNKDVALKRQVEIVGVAGEPASGEEVAAGDARSGQREIDRMLQKHDRQMATGQKLPLPPLESVKEAMGAEDKMRKLVASGHGEFGKQVADGFMAFKKGLTKDQNPHGKDYYKEGLAWDKGWDLASKAPKNEGAEEGREFQPSPDRHLAMSFYNVGYDDGVAGNPSQFPKVGEGVIPAEADTETEKIKKLTEETHPRAIVHELKVILSALEGESGNPAMDVAWGTARLRKLYATLSREVGEGVIPVDADTETEKIKKLTEQGKFAFVLDMKSMGVIKDEAGNPRKFPVAEAQKYVAETLKGLGKLILEEFGEEDPEVGKKRQFLDELDKVLAQAEFRDSTLFVLVETLKELLAKYEDELDAQRAAKRGGQAPNMESATFSEIQLVLEQIGKSLLKTSDGSKALPEASAGFKEAVDHLAVSMTKIKESERAVKESMLKFHLITEEQEASFSDENISEKEKVLPPGWVPKENVWLWNEVIDALDEEGTLFKDGKPNYAAAVAYYKAKLAKAVKKAA